MTPPSQCLEPVSGRERCRTWTLRRHNNNRYHGTVRLLESPLLLCECGKRQPARSRPSARLHSTSTSCSRGGAAANAVLAWGA